MPLPKEEILHLLRQLHQEHLAVDLDLLSSSQQHSFLAQLQKYPSALLQKQRALLTQVQTSRPSFSFSPLTSVAHSGSPERRQTGETLLSQGKVACLILAGGQGTRLGTNTSKALVPVSPIKQKTLLQLFCEKTLAASTKAGRPLSLALMTSPLNHAEIEEHLTQAHLFGLSPNQISLFPQQTLPLLDEAGNWFCEEPGKLAEAPDGNGHALLHLYQIGIWAKWKKESVAFVNVILIDNPLADPFDPELVAYHAENRSAITVKAIPRLHPEEKVGVLGIQNKKLHVVEYSELSPEQRSARHPDGTLQFGVANISLFCFSLDFIEEQALNSPSLPWHLAHKMHPVWKKTAQGGLKENTMIWKCETFIFDLLDQTANSQALLYPREETYAPLKNRIGESSLATVQTALLARDRHLYTQISGLPAPPRPFELDQAFHYPTPTLLEKWRGRSLPPQDYIAP